MQHFIKTPVMISLWLSLLFCTKKIDQDGIPQFESTPQKYPLNPGTITEASGIADSKANPGFLWVQQDSGNPTGLFLLQHNGSVKKSIHLENCVNRDWEDMALSTGPESGKHYLYIAETGDNQQQQSSYAFYRLEEPSADADTIEAVEKITFTYPDGSHDAEAFIVDPSTKDIFIITKRDNLSGVYKLTYPYSTAALNTTEKKGSLTYNYVTAAAISPDRKGLVIKTYTTIYYYPLQQGESIDKALAKTPATLPYMMEPQGEAIAFAADNSGYFTLSEKVGSATVQLSFYKRK